MGILHDELHRVMRELWTDESLMTEVFRRILRSHGLTVSDEHLLPLVQSIMQGAESVEVPGDEHVQTIAITDEDVERAMHEFETAQESSAEGAIMRIVDEVSPSILQSLYDALPQALDEWHGARRAFEDRLYERWKEGLDRINMLITVAQEAGEMHDVFAPWNTSQWRVL